MKIPYLVQLKSKNYVLSLLLLGLIHGISLFLCFYLLPTGAAIFLWACGLIYLAYQLWVSSCVNMKLKNGIEVQGDFLPNLQEAVHLISQGAGLRKKLGIFILPSDQINAFAYGTLKDLSIGITNGALQKLSSRELVGVLAHEIAHVFTGDIVWSKSIRICLWILGLSAGFSLLLPFIWSAIPFSALHTFIWIAAFVGVYLLDLAYARVSEYNADLNAITLTRDPKGLAKALEKIESYRNTSGSFTAEKGSSYAYLSSHPQLQNRIRLLWSVAA